MGIHLPMQSTRVWALVWEDPTCPGATKPESRDYRACVLQLLNSMCPRAYALQREKPRQWEGCTLRRRVPLLPQLEKACTQQRPTTAKNQYIKSFLKKKEGQVRAADPEEGCFSGDGGEAMALHFPSEQESALTQAGVPWEEEKVEQKEPSCREVTFHTPANLWGLFKLNKVSMCLSLLGGSILRNHHLLKLCKNWFVFIYSGVKFLAQMFFTNKAVTGYPESLMDGENHVSTWTSGEVTWGFIFLGKTVLTCAQDWKYKDSLYYFVYNSKNIEEKIKA